MGSMYTRGLACPHAPAGVKAMDSFECASCGSRAPGIWRSRYGQRAKQVAFVVIGAAFFLIGGIASQLLEVRARDGQASPLETGIGVTAALVVWLALSL